MNDPKAQRELIKNFGINGYENIRSLAEINLRTWERLVEKQIDAFGLFVDAGIDQLTANGNSQDIKATLENHAALGKRLSENMAVKGRETIDLANQASNEYRRWLENGINTFNSKVSAVASEAFRK